MTVITKEINKKIQKYNELTEAWLKGSKWLGISTRTQSELERGEIRLHEVLKELNEVYMDIKELGIKVIPEELLKVAND